MSEAAPDGGREVALRGPHDTDSDSSRSDAILATLGDDPVSHATEPLCRRCARPTGRTARNAIYCLDCSGLAYREGIRNRKRKGGSRAQFEAVMALWRDGTLAKVLEQVTE